MLCFAFAKMFKLEPACELVTFLVKISSNSDLRAR